MDFKVFTPWVFLWMASLIKVECSKSLVNWGFQYILLSLTVYPSCAYTLTCLIVCGLWNKAHWLIIHIIEHSSGTYYTHNREDYWEVAVLIAIAFHFILFYHLKSPSISCFFSFKANIYYADEIWTEQYYLSIYGDSSRMGWVGQSFKESRPWKEIVLDLELIIEEHLLRVFSLWDLSIKFLKTEPTHVLTIYLNSYKFIFIFILKNILFI